MADNFDNMPEDNKDKIKALGLQALLEQGNVKDFFGVQLKEKEGNAKGKLIDSFARIADMVTQHSEGVFVDEITERMTAKLEQLAEQLAQGLSTDLQGAEESIRQMVAETDEASRTEILENLSDQVAQAERNMQAAIREQLNTAMPELAEAARLTPEEVADIVDQASLSVESQMGELIGIYLAENGLTAGEIDGFKDAVEAVVKDMDLSDLKVDFKNIKDFPTVLKDFAAKGGKTQLRFLADVKVDGMTDGQGITWNATTQNFENATLDSLPTQTGNNGKFLTTDGTTASWATLAGGGDMAAATYDPNTVSGDAFLMTNMNGGNHKMFYTNGTGDVTELTHGASGKYLMSNGATSAPTWETVSASVTALDDVGDVTITTIASGELLKWNGSAWVNNTLAEAGVSAVGHTHTASEITDFDIEVANNSAVAANTAKTGVTTEISNVVEDTTPQLGGSLDVNGQKIVSVTNGNIDIEPNGTGNVLLGNFTFDADQTVGAGQDNYVLTYDNATGLISLEAASGGGYTNLTSFVDQTAWRLFYSNTDGDVTELGFGTSGQYLKSQGATSAPTWDTPAGSGDVTAAASITDTAIVRGDGGAKGVQETGWFITNAGKITNNASFSTWGLNLVGNTPAVTNIGQYTAINSSTGAPGISAFTARGTTGSETASQAGDWLLLNTGRGYGTTGYPAGSKGRFLVVAAENWTDSAQGTNLEFHTTPTGSATPAKVTEMTGSALNMTASTSISFDGTAILSDSAGTMTLSNIDALDATTEATIESAIDTLSNLTSVGTVTSGNVDAVVSAASTTTAGKVELATTAETTTGTDTGRAVTPDSLAGSIYGTKSVVIQAVADATDVAVGDGAAHFFIPSAVGGMDLVGVHAYVEAAGTTGTTDVQIHNETQAADMLTTKITIDSTETSSRTAAAAPVIDTANDDVAAGDKIRIDVDAVSTTAPKGLYVELEFRTP